MTAPSGRRKIPTATHMARTISTIRDRRESDRHRGGEHREELASARRSMLDLLLHLPRYRGIEAELLQHVHEEVVLAPLEGDVARRQRAKRSIEPDERLQRQALAQHRRIDLERALRLDRDPRVGEP